MLKMSGEVNTVVIQGNMRTLWSCLDPRILLEGPAGTSKTRTVLELYDYICRKYKGARFLIARKTRTSMTNSIMHTYQTQVMQTDTRFHTPTQSYQFANGSAIVVGGMDKATRILSTEYDGIYGEEAIEFTKDEIETLETRLRHFVVPYQQLILGTNPGALTNWMNQQANEGRLTRIRTSHEDNPRYYNESKNEFTSEGEKYLTLLGNLTGVRKIRYLDGKWASSEGLVYPDFDPLVHTIKAEDLPPFVDEYMSIDFGFTNPFTCGWWGVDSDGRLYRWREIYMTQRTVGTHAKQINSLNAGKDLLAITDHDADGRATLSENGIRTTIVNKAITKGIDAVTERLKMAGDGKPRIFFVEHCVVEIDQSLKDKNQPISTYEELTSYSWPSGKAGKNESENPIAAYDHGLDDTRYFIVFKDGIGSRQLVAW